MPFSADDRVFMARALALAERGRFHAHPNPMVGCVLARGARVVGEGHHAFFGGPHAEEAALHRAGARARGATLYVTLEPCARWGKRPPCVEAVIRSGVRRVVVAARDPHSKGRDGVGALRAAGLRVDVGLMKSEAEALNRAFLTAQRRKRPYVIWKTAQTLDGKVASRTGASRWITGRPARSMVHELRAQSDAVLVGAGTVRTDDPALTSHGLGPDPLRLVLSRSLNLSPGARVFRGPGESWVATGPRPPRRRLQPLERAGVRVRSYPFVGKSIDLKAFLLDLFRCGVRQVLVEGTGDLSWSLLSAGLVDEVFAFYAPSFLGGAASPTALAGAGWPRPDRGPRLGEVDVRRIGEDVLVHGYLCPLRE